MALCTSVFGNDRCVTPDERAARSGARARRARTARPATRRTRRRSAKQTPATLSLPTRPRLRKRDRGNTLSTKSLPLCRSPTGHTVPCPSFAQAGACAGLRHRSTDCLDRAPPTHNHRRRRLPQTRSTSLRRNISGPERTHASFDGTGSHPGLDDESGTLGTSVDEICAFPA